MKNPQEIMTVKYASLELCYCALDLPKHFSYKDTCAYIDLKKEWRRYYCLAKRQKDKKDIVHEN